MDESVKKAGAASFGAVLTALVVRLRLCCCGFMYLSNALILAGSSCGSLYLQVTRE